MPARGPALPDPIPLEEAAARLRARWGPRCGTTTVPLAAAAGRVLVAPARLDRDEPPWPRSAMDGFAMRSAEGAAPRREVGAAPAGRAAAPALERGDCVRVMTGGLVPAGADCVVPRERVRRDAEGRVVPEAAPRPGEHVRAAGELGRAGAEVLAAGRRIGAGELAVLAGCGADPVPVFARPRLAVVATGDEVVPWTETPRVEQVRDANRPALGALALAAGAAPVSSRLVADDPAALAAALEAALAAADLVVTVGGVSMGDHDHLPRLLPRLGVEPLFHRVRIQPGKPVWLGRRGADGPWVLGLPGNPVSAFVVFALLGVPLLRVLGGEADVPLPTPHLPGTAAAPVRSGARPLWRPARLEACDGAPPRVRPLGWTGSGDWTALAGADALLHLPPRSEVAAGGAVLWQPLPPPVLLPTFAPAPR